MEKQNSTTPPVADAITTKEKLVTRCRVSQPLGGGFVDDKYSKDLILLSIVTQVSIYNCLGVGMADFGSYMRRKQ